MSDDRRAPSAELGLVDAILLGMGAMIGAGIFVLTGLAAETAGPGAIFVFLLNGLVTALTGLSYAELASTIPKSGGGYAFVAEVFPDWMSFLMGWMLWFAYMVAGSLYALGFAPNFVEFFHYYVPGLPDWTLAYALGAIVFLVGVNAISTGASGRAESIVTLIKIGVLALFVAFGLGAVDLGEFQPMFPGELTPVSLLPAMGLTFIAFEGYDLIATVTEEIENPRRNVPLAIAASLGATVVVYLLVVFVAIGTLGADRLGASGETAIAEAAGQFMPNMPLIGEAAAVIAFGAVFSTISALNAVVLASSRVAFAMGRDDLLWSRFGQLHPRFGTPVAALLASGAVMVTVAFVPSVQSVGNLTSLFFLLSFVLVNAAVVKLRWERPNQSRPFEIPGFPIPPMLAIVCNVVLGFFIEPTTWLLGLGWLAVGGLVYRGRSGGDEADSNAQEET